MINDDERESARSASIANIGATEATRENEKRAAEIRASIERRLDKIAEGIGPFAPLVEGHALTTIQDLMRRARRLERALLFLHELDFSDADEVRVDCVPDRAAILKRRHVVEWQLIDVWQDLDDALASVIEQ